MNHTEDTQDRQLFAQIKAGSHSAFEKLFRKYYADLCAYSSRFVDASLVEDVVQTSLTYIWEMREHMHIRSSLRSYVFKMVYHESIKVAKQVSATDKILSYMEDYRLSQSIDEREFMDAKELRQRIFKSIESLSPTYREALMMHRFEGKSYKEIALMLGVSPKTIDYRIQQALKNLRISLRDYLPAVYVAVLLNFLESPESPEQYVSEESVITSSRLDP